MRNGLKRMTVAFEGVRLDCEFMYYAGFPGDHTDPPEPELAEFTFVKHRDEDVYGLLGDDKVQALAELCIERMKGEYA